MLCLILGGRLIQRIDLYTAIYGISILTISFVLILVLLFHNRKFPLITYASP